MVAKEHYWQVTDADFMKAIGDDAEAAQKTASGRTRQVAMGRRRRGQQKKAPVLLGSATESESPQNRGMGDTRLELVTPSLSS